MTFGSILISFPIKDEFEDEKVAMSRTRFISLLLFFFLPTIASAEEPCAFWEFPTLFGDIITIRNGSNLTLPFRIRFSKPRPIESYEGLGIYVGRIRDRIITPVCKLITVNGSCLKHTHSPCGCGSEEFTYQFQTIVDQRDSGTWLWGTGTEMMQSKRLFFNVYIEDETRVIDLTFHNVTSTNTVDKDTTVDVVCIWQSGNPPAQARLLDRHGKEMVIGSYGPLRYTLTSVRCDDSGQYRCEAPRATENKTATLLVKCPPEITFPLNDITTVSGATTDLKVYVRSHTRILTDCWLMKLFRSKKSRMPLPCDATSSLPGSPPDLLLNVPLDNVKESDNGVWRLELRNDAGIGHADFRLKVAPASEESLWPSSVPVIVPVVSGLAGAVGVLVVAVPVMLLCRRCCRRRAGVEFGQESAGVEVGQESAGVEVGQYIASNQSADLYSEIPDEAVRTVEGSSQNVSEPPRPCQRRMRHDRPDPAPDLFYMSSTIKGLSSSKKRKKKDAAKNVTTASSSKTDTTSSDGYLTPRPLRKRTEDIGGGATAMLPRSDTGLPTNYLTPASRQNQAEEGSPENVALLPMSSETSPEDSSPTPLLLREEKEHVDTTTDETASALCPNAPPPPL